MLITLISTLSDSIENDKIISLSKIDKKRKYTKVNGSLLKFTYFCPNSRSRFSLYVLFMRYLRQHNSILICKMQILK